jgi:uncharacterized protein
LRPVCKKLRPLATLSVVQGADHSFHMLKRSGTSDTAVLQQLVQTVASWAEKIRG